MKLFVFFVGFISSCCVVNGLDLLGSILGIVSDDCSCSLILKQIDTTLKNHKTDLHNVNSDMENLEKKIDELESKLKAQKERIFTVNKLKEHRTETAGKLNAVIASQTESIGRVDNKVKEIDEKLDDLEEITEDQKYTLVTLKDIASKLDDCSHWNIGNLWGILFK